MDHAVCYIGVGATTDQSPPKQKNWQPVTFIWCDIRCNMESSGNMVCVFFTTGKCCSSGWLHVFSVAELEFRGCKKLQRLPAGLTKLTNLKRLQIWYCPAIQLLPKDGLPSSLQELVISGCPDIKSLPKDGLPSSLSKLQVDGISEELKRQCQKLKGTVPIIIDYY